MYSVVTKMEVDGNGGKGGVGWRSLRDIMTAHACGRNVMPDMESSAFNLTLLLGFHEMEQVIFRCLNINDFGWRQKHPYNVLVTWLNVRVRKQACFGKMVGFNSAISCKFWIKLPPTHGRLFLWIDNFVASRKKWSQLDLCVDEYKQN